MASMVDSLVGPMSLLNALLVLLSEKRTEVVEQRFDLLEGIWKDYDVYETMTEDQDSNKVILS